MADRGPTATLMGVDSSTASSSIIGRSVGSETTISSVLPIAAVRHEAVAQHQVGRNRSEQLLVDAERVHVHELEPVPLREPPRLFELGAAIDLADRIRARRVGVQVGGAR